MLKKLMIDFHARLLKMPVWLFILSMVIAKNVLLLMSTPLYLVFPSLGEGLDRDIISMGSIFDVFIIVVIIAPILETLFCQKFVMHLTRKVCYIEKRKVLQLLISSLLFGALHYSSLANMFSGFLMGIVFGYSFLVYEYKKCCPVVVVSIIHALSNLVALIILMVDLGIIK